MNTPSWDPSNAPPHLWLEHDYQHTSNVETTSSGGGGSALTIAAVGCSCVPAPGLEIERRRLQDVIKATWSGTCGDANHRYGYHVPACRLSSSDYSLKGGVNTPVDRRHGCAIDIGMNWPASRTWLRWLIGEIRADRITGIAEVIGSYNGRDVRYWSDASGWHTDGVRYTGTGHDTWTHVAIYRSTANQDHKILAGWTRTGLATPTQEDDMAALNDYRYDPGDGHGGRDIATMIADLWAIHMRGKTSGGPHDDAFILRRTQNIEAVANATQATTDKLATALADIQAGRVDIPTLVDALVPALGPQLSKQLADDLIDRLKQ